MMSLAEIRLKQNPIATSLLLGCGQGTMVGERLFPRMPQALSGAMLAKVGNERLKRYNLRRAPGSATKRIDIKYDGTVYTVNQYSIEVPMARELIREADESRKLNVSAHLDVSQIAMTTANDVLGIDYELECASLGTNSGAYANGHVMALSGGTKWSSLTGTPVTDIKAASNVIRKKIGKRPNRLVLSPDAKLAIEGNVEVKSYLPSTQTGSASTEQLCKILEVEEIVCGDGIYIDAADVGQDIWGNNAVLAYVPKIGGAGNNISLVEPAFGFTNVLEGHPFAETPYYEPGIKSWVYGATFERQANIAYNTAAFLFQNPK